MTSDQECLLAAIVARPDDDLPRLVYADWVEDHAADEVDEARAEFIRLQVARSRTGLLHWSAPDEAVLLSECREYWQEHWEPSARGSVTYDRGFPFELLAPDGLWGDADSDGGPQHLPPFNGPLGAVLSGDPELRLLASLCVQCGGMGDLRDVYSQAIADALETHPVRSLDVLAPLRSLRPLWQSSGLAKVANLTLSTFEEHDTFEELADCRLQATRCVDLHFYHGFQRAGVDRILGRSVFPAARDVSLRGVHCAAQAGRSALCRAAQRVVIEQTELDGRCDYEALAELTASPHLTELCLTVSEFAIAGLPEFIASLPAGRLKLLQIRVLPPRGHGFQSQLDTVMDAVRRSRVLNGLTHLDLEAGNSHDQQVCTDATTFGLIEDAAAAGVKRLAVSVYWDKRRAVAALRRVTALGRLEYFNVPESQNGKSPEIRALKARLGGRAVPNLTADWLAGQRRWNPL